MLGSRARSHKLAGSCWTARRTLETTIVSIGGESWRTELAESLMVLHHTGRVAGAGRASARVLALVLDACLARWAASVLEADLDGGITAGGADTDGLVVEHLALLACWADRRVVTRVLATSAAAGLVGRAVVMDATLYLTIGAGELALLVYHQAVLAATLGLVALHRALLVKGTGLGGTRVEALASLGVTGCVLSTVLVGPTSKGWGDRKVVERLVTLRIWPTSDMGPTNEALWAFTARLVDDHIADGIVTTCCP